MRGECGGGPAAGAPVYSRRVQAAPDGLILATAQGRLALLSTVAASGMASLDATVVNVGLPRIGEEFGAAVGALQWVLTGYLLALSSLILLAGALGDRFGRRRIFVVGTVWFAVASLACGVAPSVEALVAARVLQGVGGALLTPGSLAILQASFRPADRAAAVAAWSGLGGVAGAIGPFVGGGLVDGPGWRWAFLLNVPVAGVVVACAHAAVPETRDPQSSRALDVFGAVLATAALGASTWALTNVGVRGWNHPFVLACSAVAVVAGACFVWRMLRSTDPLVPPALFHSRVFSVVNMMTVPLYGALGVVFFLVAFHLQVSAGWTALQAGAALLPATVLMLLGSGPSGALAERVGPRLQLVIGPLMTGAGVVLLAHVGPDATSLAAVLPGAVVFGLGLTMFVSPLTAAVMAAVDAGQVGTASGVNNAVARAASLGALAFVPVVSGLATASGTEEVTAAYRTGMLIAAGGAFAAAVVAAVGLRARAGAGPSGRRVHCAVDGAPLQPDTGVETRR